MPITQSTVLPLQYGEFTISYHKTKRGDCISISMGELTQGTPVVRMHASCLFGEALHALDCDCAAQLVSTLKLIKKHKAGVLVYRYAEGRGIGLENKIRALELQRTKQINTVEAFKLMGFEPDERTYEVETAALKDLNVSLTIKVATQNPRKLRALEQGGYTITKELHPGIQVTKYNLPELLTKKRLLGYNIDLGTKTES